METHRERERLTQRGRDSQRERLTERERRRRERERERERDSQREGETPVTETGRDSQRDSQTDRKRQRDSQTDRQTSEGHQKAEAENAGKQLRRELWLHTMTWTLIPSGFLHSASSAAASWVLVQRRDLNPLKSLISCTQMLPASSAVLASQYNAEIYTL